MAEVYAQDFHGIAAVLAQNSELRVRVLLLIEVQPMPGKVTEGGDRMARFRAILVDLVNGQIDLQRAIHRTQAELPRQMSLHSSNNRVFCQDWDERLVRTQLSRFYNQAVMEKLLEDGETMCHVPHSAAEQSDSKCSMVLAGRNHDLRSLYNLLISSYAQGNWSQVVKIPDHPHCTHVIVPAKT